MSILELVPLDEQYQEGLLPLERVVAGLRKSRNLSRAADPHKPYVGNLPSPEAVSLAIRGLTAGLFPRHAGGQDGNDDGLDYYVGHTLNTSLRGLSGQVERELSLTEGPAAVHSKRAVEIVRQFAEQLPAIRDVLVSDVRAAFDGDPSAKATEEVLLTFPGVKAVIHHRLAHALYLLGVPVLARIVAELSHAATGIDIHPGAEIGGHFFIDHGTGVVIGETAVIGERVRLYQAVTLGAKKFSVEEDGSLVKGAPRHPIVQDDVVIYAGATILGRVTIGRGSVIGGNVWLTQSVAPHSHIQQSRPRSEQFSDGAGI